MNTRGLPTSYRTQSFAFTTVIQLQVRGSGRLKKAKLRIMIAYLHIMQQPVVVVDYFVLFCSSPFLCYCVVVVVVVASLLSSFFGGWCVWKDSLFAILFGLAPHPTQPLRLSNLLSLSTLQSHCTKLPCPLRLFSMQQKCTSLFLSFSSHIIHPSFSFWKNADSEHWQQIQTKTNDGPLSVSRTTHMVPSLGQQDKCFPFFHSNSTFESGGTR